MLGMFNPIIHSYLQFDTADYAPKPQTADACRMSGGLSLDGISQNKNLCEAEQHGIYKCI
jgi:hypothetical protein